MGFRFRVLLVFRVSGFRVQGLGSAFVEKKHSANGTTFLTVSHSPVSMISSWTSWKES